MGAEGMTARVAAVLVAALVLVVVAGLRGSVETNAEVDVGAVVADTRCERGPTMVGPAVLLVAAAWVGVAAVMAVALAGAPALVETALVGAPVVVGAVAAVGAADLARVAAMEWLTVSVVESALAVGSAGITAAATSGCSTSAAASIDAVLTGATAGSRSVAALRAHAARRCGSYFGGGGVCGRPPRSAASVSSRVPNRPAQ